MLRTASAAFLITTFLMMLTAGASSEVYPARPITIVVPQAAGGGTDIISRLVGQQLSAQLDVSVVIENRSGAGLLVGTEAVAKALPDGYTLLTGITGNMAVNPSLYKALRYDPVRDFTPVGMLAEFPLVLVVGKDLPVNSVQDLVALARSKPGAINFASGGVGTGQHLSGEMFKLMAGVEMTHVPYRGSAPAYSDVISGRIQVFFDSLTSALGQIKGGTVRPLAVTSKERSRMLPNIPTVRESGLPDFENAIWFGLWAPRGTPQPIVQKLYQAIQRALADPAIKAKIEADGGRIMQMALEDIEPMVKHDIAKWADLVKRANIERQ